MNAIKATVLLRDATDSIFIEMDCPHPIIPYQEKENLSLQFEATYDTGIDYVRKHFNLEPKVVNSRYD